MINRTEIKLPYPTRVGFFVKKRVGFSFDELAIFFMHQSIGVNSQSELKKWLEKNSDNHLYIETLWAATKSYCHHNVKRHNLDKSKFIKGLAMMDKKTAKELMTVWNNSQTFGTRKPYNAKKKVAKK